MVWYGVVVLCVVRSACVWFGCELLCDVVSVAAVCLFCVLV